MSQHYRLIHGSEQIERLTDGAIIPADPGNADYAAYVRWLAAGNEAAPAPAPVAASPVPQSVARWRARAALRMAGLLAAVEAAVAASDIPTQEWWAAGLDMERSDPRVVAIGAVIGLDSNDIDTLFIQAAGL